MSTRTVIEINHDYMQDLLDHPEHFRELLRRLSWGDYNDILYREGRVRLPAGMTILGQRHHSETLNLEVK